MLLLMVVYREFRSWHLIPWTSFLILEKIQKSQGFRFGEYPGWGKVSILWYQRKWTMDPAM